MTEAVEQAFRDEWPRVLAALVRYTGSVELAEDAVAEAFERAVSAGPLDNPAAWVTTVAKRIAVDAIRREAAFEERMPRLLDEQAPVSTADDDRLELLFVACSPDLTPDDRIAIALRFVCGVSTADIAHAMLVTHPAMSARLTRAKRRIDEGGIRFDDGTRGDRLADVLAVVYVLYTLGHTAPDGDEFSRLDLTRVAIDLGRSLRRSHGDSDVAGLLALMLLTEARRATRAEPLEHADRSLWSRPMITAGLELAAEALRDPGRYAFEAAISGLHSSAVTWADTDWAAIVTMYDRLIERWPSPPALIARVVARSFLLGPEAVIDDLDDSPWAIPVRADLLRRMGRGLEARAEYARAAKLEKNAAVRSLFERRASGL